MKRIELLSNTGFIVSAIGLSTSVIQMNHDNMIWWTILLIISCGVMHVTSLKQEKEDSLKYIKRY